MMAQERRFPQAVSRSSGSDPIRKLPSTSLTSREERLSSTESAVDMIAATMPVRTKTVITYSQMDSAAQTLSRRGMTWSVSTPSRPDSCGMARIPTRTTAEMVTSGMKAMKVNDRFRLRVLRAAKIRWMAWG